MWHHYYTKANFVHKMNGIIIAFEVYLLQLHIVHKIMKLEYFYACIYMAYAYSLWKPKSTFAIREYKRVCIYKRCSCKVGNVLEFNRQAWPIMTQEPFLKECPFFYEAILHINWPNTYKLFGHLHVNWRHHLWYNLSFPLS